MTDGLKTDETGYIVLTPKLARIARETAADIATPAGSLGVIGKCGKRYAYVSVGNALADDYGTTRHEIGTLTVNPDTVEYWRRMGYVA
jgi:hypothetical protein